MGNFLSNLQVKLQTFMVGRNGADTLSKVALGAAVILTFVNMFIGSMILSVLGYVCLFYSVYRMFSRNTVARQREDEAFRRLIHRPKQAKAHFDARKTTVFFKCDECGQSLSVPRGKGTLKVTCPKCKHQTTIKS